MNMSSRVIVFGILLGLMLHPVSLLAQDVFVPIKNIARVDGVRENQLRGFGVVVGLAGTGDGDLNFVNRAISNALGRLGIEVQNPADASLENIAAVMVTAALPPFKKPGDEIDVTVSSVGSASDLTGGVLMQSPLKAANGQIYAVAQGSITKGGDAENRHLTTVRIPNGALVERKVPFEFIGDQNRLRLQLRETDFTTANRIARTINQNFEQTIAKATNGSQVRVTVPTNFRDNPVEFISLVENLEVTPAAENKIVINERTGTVLMGGDVAVHPVSISHQDISVQVEDGGEDGQTQETVSFPEASTVGEVVDSLNAVGASTDSVIAILEAMDKAGSLNAPLEVM